MQIAAVESVVRDLGNTSSSAIKPSTPPGPNTDTLSRRNSSGLLMPGGLFCGLGGRGADSPVKVHPT